MRSIHLALCCLLVVALCSHSLQAASPNGKWRGSWTSQSTGHQGALRANIRQLPNGDYRALFAGRFAGVIPFVYPATLSPIPGSPSQYSSTQQLPLLGSYHMSATVTPSQFHATFSSRKDSGIFRMSRVR